MASSLGDLTKKYKLQLEPTVTIAPKKVETQDAAPASEDKYVAPDLSKNVFAQTMSRTNLVAEDEKATTVKEKIVFAADDPLKLRSEDVTVLEAVLNDYEQYYASLQDGSIDTDQESIRQLVERIENADAPKMREMLATLIATNTDIKQCSTLLNVMKAAHGLKMTINDIVAAIEVGNKLKRDLDRANSDVAVLETRFATARMNLTTAQAEVDNAPRGFLGWGGVPEDLTRALNKAKNDLASAEQSLKTRKVQQEDAQKAFSDNDTLISDPRLQILRGFDMTKKVDLKEKIVSLANNSIETVNSVRDSLRVLMARVSKSETAMVGIINDIDNARIDRAVLISAFSEAYAENVAKTDVVTRRCEELQTSLNAIVDQDTVEAGRLRVELMRLGTTQRAMLSYNKRVDTMLKMMRETDALSVVAAHDSGDVLQSVRNNRDGFNTIANQSLPSVSSATKLVLHQFVDDQDQNFRMAIGDVTGQLGDTAAGASERALEQQAEYHKLKIEGLEATIARLDGASDLLGRSLEQAVDASKKEEAAYKKVTAKATELRDGMNASGDIQQQVRDRARKAKEQADTALADPQVPVEVPVADEHTDETV